MVVFCLPVSQRILVCSRAAWFGVVMFVVSETVVLGCLWVGVAI